MHLSRSRWQDASAEHNTVTLSDGSDLMADRVLCSRPNWIAMDALDGPMEVTVRLRHSRTEAPAAGRSPCIAGPHSTHNCADFL